MLEQTGATYASAHFAKALFASESKVGKSCFLIASALGVFPGQTKGGIVDRPENLHIMSFDEAALKGVKRFLIETCGAPESVLNFRIYNMEDDFRKIVLSNSAYDRDFYNTVLLTINKIADRCKTGVPVVIPSSLTTLAEGLVRGTLGPAGEKKGAGGDQAKWADFGAQMTELRNHAHGIPGHVFWEAHIYTKPVAKSGEWGGADAEETLQIPGRSGVNFPANVGYVFRVRRTFKTKVLNTKADVMYIDTSPTFNFATGGRNVNEALDAKEMDLTNAFMKLGLKVGNWGAKVKAPAVKAVVK
jgi:hypothetical protein